MPAVHAFTGCDFTAAFYRKGKAKSVQLLETDAEGKFAEIFSKLSNTTAPSQVDTMEEFVCSLYGMKGETRVDDARYAKLLRMTGRNDKVSCP